MTENKRYFSVDYDEEYYIFDSTKITEEEVLEKAEYSYDVFGDSLMGNEVLDLLNENEQLKLENGEMKDYLGRLEEENEQLKKEKKAIQQENLSMIDFMNANFDEHMTREKLNRRIIELTNENKELKKDLEYWKSNCLSYENQNSILWNEISILQKQGAKTSASFEEYVDSISTEHTRYWKRKLNKAKKDGVIE